MRKVKFMLLSIMAVFMASCTHDFEYVDYAEQITAQYNAAFVKSFGTPSPTQTWGFDNVAATRAAYPNSNQWADEGYVIPAEITQAEIDKVLAVFNQKGEEHYESLVDWDCFFVQQVWKGTASYTAGNGGTVVGGNQMDWLCAGSASMGDDHVNNFNNAAGSIMLMINSSTKRFGYKSSTDNGHVFYYFRMEYIDGAYYVGFDFSAEGQNPNEQVQRDYIYNDWIVKIVPGKGTSSTPPTEDKPTSDVSYIGLIVAEDLSVSTSTDFDFNDVVFAVGYDKNNATYVKILAAGGTLPLYVANNEVHAALGVGEGEMVNTGGKEVKPVELKISDNKLSPSEIQVTVFKNGTILPLLAPKGEPAAKIFIPDTEFKWCDERKDINVVYPMFKKWVNGEVSQDTEWWK